MNHIKFLIWSIMRKALLHTVLQAFTNKFNLVSGLSVHFFIVVKTNLQFWLIPLIKMTTVKELGLFLPPLLAPLHYNSRATFLHKLIFSTPEENLFKPAHSRKNQQDLENLVMLLSRDLKESWPHSPDELKNHGFMSFLWWALKTIMRRKGK